MKAVVFLVVLSFSVLSFAADNNSKMKPDFYIGIGGISGDQEFASVKQSTSGKKVFLFEKTKWGLVGELHLLDLDYNKTSGDKDALYVRSLGYSILYSVGQTENVMPYFKFGYHNWKANYFVSETEPKHSSQSSFFYGLGVNIHMFKTWFLRVEHETFTIKADETTASLNLSSISIFSSF